MAVVPYPSFGTLLKRWRLGAGLTQEALAERSGLSVRGISDLERGVKTRPHRDTMLLLAEALALTEEERTTLYTASRGAAPRAVSARAAATEISSGPLPMPNLVGRDHELLAIEQHLNGMGPGVLMLVGEPGIGKSRLLGEAVRLGSNQGMAVLQGGCNRRSSGEPYSPLIEAFVTYIALQGPAQRRSLLRGATWLVRLVPELLEVVKAPLPLGILPPEQERRLAFTAATRFLANAADSGGVLLVLDDLQWAGPDALDLLVKIAQSSSDVPVRIVAAYRDTEVELQSELALALADLTRAGLASSVTVHELSVDDATRLVREMLPGERWWGIPERIVRGARGMPFFLMSYAQGVRSGEVGEDAIPQDVAQSIRYRVFALSPTAQELLRTAAIMGRVVSRAVLFAVISRSEEEILTALDETSRARLLLERGRDECQFVHDLIRDVVEGDLSVARRAVLHRRVAEALERKTSTWSAELLAHHYLHSDTPEKAMPHLEAAGDLARVRFAHSTAVTYYRDLAVLSDGLGRTEESARASEKLGVAFRLIGQYDAALRSLEGAVSMYRLRRDLAGEVRTLAEIGWVHSFRGTADEGLALIRPVLEAFDPDDVSPGLASLYLAFARLCNVAGDCERELAAAERAVEIAGWAGDDWILAGAQAERSDALVTWERFTEGIRVGEEAAVLAEQTGNLCALYAALSAASFAYLVTGNFVQARDMVDKSVTAAERLCDPEVILEARCMRSIVTLHSGEWALAQIDAEEALSLGRTLGPSNPAASALVTRATIAVRQGDLDAAAQQLAECISLANRNDNAHQLCFAETQLAERDLLMGHPAEAHARLAPFADRIRSPNRMTTWYWPTLAAAEVEVGHLREAADLLARALAHARTTGNCVGLVEALRVQAMLLLIQGQREEARRSLDEGLELTKTMHYPYGEARFLSRIAQLQTEANESAEARATLEEGLTIFRRLGAKKEIERTELTLATLHLSVGSSCD